jgi:hypothetical protein
MTAREIPELVDLDILGDPETLRAEADAVLESEEPSSEYKAADASGSIWVTVDPQGRLVDVEISRTWSERMAPDAFGDALFRVYLAAMQKAIVVETAAREEPPAPRSRPAPAVEELSNEEWLASIRAELDKVDDVLRAVRAGEVVAAEESEIRGRNGYLTLRLSGGAPDGITGSAALAHARRERLREDALDIFTDAGLAGEL